MSRRSAWAPPLVWAGLILVLGHLPPPIEPHALFPHVDKIVHFSEYSVLGVLLVRATRGSEWSSPMAGAIILGLLFAIIDEAHQAWIPSRVSDMMDFAADGIGIIGGSLTQSRLAALLALRRKRNIDP